MDGEVLLSVRTNAAYKIEQIIEGSICVHSMKL